MRCKEKFVEKQEFHIPSDMFVEIKLSEKEFSKIAEWIENDDSIGVFARSGNFIVLINDTKRKNQHLLEQPL